MVYFFLNASNKSVLLEDRILSPFIQSKILISKYCQKGIVRLFIFLSLPGWPRHRENREFGSYFFQTGKNTGNFALTQGKILRHRENIFL